MGHFYRKGGETMEQATRELGDAPSPGNIEGLVGQSSEEPVLVEVACLIAGELA